MKLCYKISEVKTSLGPLRVKTAFWGGQGTNDPNDPDSGGGSSAESAFSGFSEFSELRRTPEYDDLKRLAKEYGLSMPEARARILRELGEAQ